MAERLTGMRRTPVRADPRQSRGHGLTEGCNRSAKPCQFRDDGGGELLRRPETPRPRAVISRVSRTVPRLRRTVTEGLPGDRRVPKGWVPCARMAGLK